MSKEQLRRVDRWRAEQFDGMKRPAAIRALVERGLKR
jgi:hypothetical protein